ncbi:MAG: hypothetical protein DRO39_01015 [Thermoprotei archaeon]|mgnify:CR=1 FL=1|nr:MAG: hypothetical protein DRO39_01015 [Thermoprotei archaeon]
MLDLARGKVSIHGFLEEPVNIENTLYAIDVAHNAPLGANRQPWKSLVVTDSPLKKRFVGSVKKPGKGSTSVNPRS